MRTSTSWRLSAPLAVGLAMVMVVVSAASFTSVPNIDKTPYHSASFLDYAKSTAVAPTEGEHTSLASLDPVRGGAPVATPPDAAVNPLKYYTTQPAPMGMADFGVTVGGNPYTYNSTEFLANFSWKGINLHGSVGNPSSDTSFTVQLNVVLVFAKDSTTYSYWIQDVAFLNSSTLQVNFIDNVWNLSAPSACLGSSAVLGNGSVVPSSCFYYDQAIFQPGAFRVMPTPGDIVLLVRSYQTGGGAPEVAFSYWDGVGGGLVTFDNVIWPWASGAGSDSNFVVDGSTYTPDDLYYDAEAILGGPGNRSSVAADNFTDTSICLFYWNGHNFQAPRSAWNFGSDTGETISNVQSIWLNTYTSAADGTPLMVQLNGTTFDAGLDNVYTESSVGYLNVSAPGISKGVVVVGSTNWTFFGGEANVTLTPGTYHVWVNSSAGAEDLGECVITGGAITHTVLGAGCTPTTSVPIATPQSVDLGQTVTISTALMSAGSGGDTFTWSVSSSNLGCASSTSATLHCKPTFTGTYAVAVTIRDSDNQSMTTLGLEFFVYADPTVELFVSREAIDVGQEVTFIATASGGSPGYVYTWSGLPPGCTTLPQEYLNCVPTSGGTFDLRAAATDSNGWVVVATASTTVYADPVLTSIHVTPTTAIKGAKMELVVNVSGGRGPYSFSYVGLPSGCASVNTSTLTCTPNQTGTFAIVVLAVDADGAVANGTTQIGVVARASGLPALEWFEIISLLVVAVIITVAAVGLRRRSRRRLSTGDRSIAERVEMYSRRVVPAPASGLPPTAAQVWAEGSPVETGASQEAYEAEATGTAGLDPGAVYLSSPLVNPPNPTCWNCHFENPPPSRYCGRCGLPLESPVDR